MIGMSLSMVSNPSQITIIQQAIAVLRKYGSDAHIYLPGASVPLLGPNLIVNGGFDVDANWTKGATWTISGGSANSDGSNGAAVSLVQPSVFTAGKTYEVSFSLVRTSGSANLYIAGVQLVFAGLNTSGEKKYTVTATSSGSMFFEAAASSSLSLDNISVREITGYNSMLNGLQAGNYLDSAGTTVGTVDQPVGLVLDAAGSLGVELVVRPYSGTVSGSWVIGGTVTRNGASTGIANVLTEAHVATKTYRVSFEVANFSGDSLSAVFGSANVGQISGNGVYTFHKAGGGPVLQFIPWAGTAGQATISNISVREVTGIHSSQPTTANKSVLKLTNGRYNWLFDSTDLLTATYPAGYESVTVIDAISTGQVTTAGANIVGAYSMGPSVTLYGRMIIRVAVSPSDLALLQGFANRLAGV